MPRVLRTLFGCLFFVALLGAGLEIGLRAWPGRLIPMSLLKKFHEDVRLEIAERLGLWRLYDTWELERDDGGPPLRLWKPDLEVGYNFGGGEKTRRVTDSQGFCNAARDTYERPTIDLFAVGDSFTMCWGTDPEVTWSSHLGALTGLSTYNLGRGGVGPYEYVQILRHFAPPKAPRFVVMNLYEGNDLRDSLRYHEHVEAARSGRVLYTDAADRNRPELDYDRLLDHPLGRRSYALNLVVAAVGKLTGVLRNEYLRATGGEVRERVNFHYRLVFPDRVVEFNPENADESDVRQARKVREGEASFTAYDDALARFAALAREYGFVPIVSYAPSAHVVYADYVEFEDPSLAELLSWFSRAQRDHLRRKAEELGLHFVDLTPALRAEAARLQGETLLYSPLNLHYTEKGHNVVAETLARVVSELMPAARAAS